MNLLKKLGSFSFSGAIGCCGICAVSSLMVPIPLYLLYLNNAISFF